MTSHRLVALVGTLVLLVSACGGGTTEAAGWGDAEPLPGPNVAQDDATTAIIGTIDTIDGPNLDVLGQGSLEGMDVVVWFWAEW